MNADDTTPDETSATLEYQLSDFETEVEAIVNLVRIIHDNPTLDTPPRQESLDHKLPPINDYVDTEAVTTLVSQAAVQQPTVRVSFTYCECDITITNTGHITVDYTNLALE